MGRADLGTVPLVILSLVAFAIASGDARARDTSTREALHRYLTERVGFSERDWRDILDNQAVARDLDSSESIDVSVYGVVRIQGEPDALVDAIRSIETFERQLKIIGVGRFSEPPRLEDLEDVVLTDQDAGDLEDCRPGHCELQLTGHAMQRFASLVDWDGDDATARAQQLYREMLFDTLRTYRVGGARALRPYVDRDEATSIADEMARLHHTLDTPIAIPALRAYLRDYPRASLPGAESMFYWNTGEFGMKPTTRLNHVVIYPLQRTASAMPGTRWVIATHQIYANHYFSATLELRTLVEDDTGDAFFLLYATRSRVPGLSGFFKAILRGIVKRRARSGMENYLTRTRALIEESDPVSR